MAILVVVPNSMWVLAILWLVLSCADGSVRAADASILNLDSQSGLMKGDYSVIDYSMHCGSFDVEVSVPAACSSAASSVVPALVPVVAAFSFPSCGLALSAELRLYPVFRFQSWNVDCVICCLSPEMVSLWIFMCVPWTLDCFSWIQNGCLVRLMATVGCVRAAALFVVMNLFLVDLFSSGLFNQVTVLAAAAAAAAIVVVHALFSLDESAAGANDDEIFVFIEQAAAAAAAAIVVVHALFSLDESAAGANDDEIFVFIEQAAGAAAAAIVVVHALFFQDGSAAGAKHDEFFVCVVQAAAALAAAIVAVRPVCESSSLVFFFAGIGSWISLRVCSLFPGLWKEQRNISLQGIVC